MVDALINGIVGFRERDPEAGGGVCREGERSPKLKYRLVRELTDDGIPAAVACRVLELSRWGP